MLRATGLHRATGVPQALGFRCGRPRWWSHSGDAGSSRSERLPASASCRSGTVCDFLNLWSRWCLISPFGQTSCTSNCIAVAPPVVRIRNATTAAWSACFGRLMLSRVFCRKDAMGASLLTGVPFCFSSFTTSFRGHRFQRCLIRQSLCGAAPDGRPEPFAINAFRICFPLASRPGLIRVGLGCPCNRWRAGRRCCVCRRAPGVPARLFLRSSRPLAAACGCSSRNDAACRFWPLSAPPSTKTGPLRFERRSWLSRAEGWRLGKIGWRSI